MKIDFFHATNFLFLSVFSMFYSQSFAGISLLDAKNVSFTNALMQTLSAEAKVPVTILSFTASTSTSTGTRQLLLSTSVSYVVYTTSNVTQSVIVPLLRSILTGSNFVTVLQKYSGFSNISVSDVVFTDLNPTSAPTSAPATKAGRLKHFIKVWNKLAITETINASHHVIQCH